MNLRTTTTGETTAIRAILDGKPHRFSLPAAQVRDMTQAEIEQAARKDLEKTTKERAEAGEKRKKDREERAKKRAERKVKRKERRAKFRARAEAAKAKSEAQPQAKPEK